jgi:hypothetical protein
VQYDDLSQVLLNRFDVALHNASRMQVHGACLAHSQAMQKLLYQTRLTTYLQLYSEAAEGGNNVSTTADTSWLGMV